VSADCELIAKNAGGTTTIKLTAGEALTIASTSEEVELILTTNQQCDNAGAVSAGFTLKQSGTIRITA